MDDDRFSPSIALLTLARRVEVQMAGALETHGLTLRKYVLLERVARIPGISNGELARRSGIAVQGVPAMVAALVAAGFIRSAEEKGEAKLSITETGAAVLADVEREVADMDASVFEASEEMVALATALAEATAPKLGAPQD